MACTRTSSCSREQSAPPNARSAPAGEQTTAPDAANVSSALAPPRVPDTSTIRWLGRVDLTGPTRPRFAWPGAGLSLRVRGERVALWLAGESDHPVFFQPVLDGRPGTRFAVASTTPTRVQLPEALGPGEHTFELYRETEAQYGATAFLGFAEGEPVGPTAASPRRIEAVGDSITAGYGNLGSEAHPAEASTPGCGFSAESSSWYATYAALAARALNAELVTIARSGWGVLPRADDVEPNLGLPAIYERALGSSSPSPWDFAGGVDAVLVNLGTNDWARGDPGAPFVEAYVRFARAIRQRNPDAWILLTIGSMLAPPERTQVERRLAAVVARREADGDRKIAWFSLGTQDTHTTGCDWHPSAADHERMALIVQQVLRRRLGW